MEDLWERERGNSMLIFENIILAVTGLKSNKMRSFLTMLGIVIGIASVIAIMTVGDSMSSSVKNSMGDMGANNISIYLSQKSAGNDTGEGEEADEGEYDDVRDMKAKDYFTETMFDSLQVRFDNSVQGISLSKSVGDAKIQNGKKYANISVNGVNKYSLQSKKLTMLAGRTLEEKEYTDGKKVALVSNRFVENMYKGDNNAALGSTLEAAVNDKYYSYTIIGIYEYKESSGGFSSGSSGKDLRTDTYIPLNTSSTLYNGCPNLISIGDTIADTLPPLILQVPNNLIVAPIFFAY